MKNRIVIDELLDHLPHDDPAARRSRLDLASINFLMGNERWILRTLARLRLPADTKICELGAGDGSLAAKLKQRFPNSQVTACDLAPRPTELNHAIHWREGDIFQHEPPSGGVLIANLFLHHFEGDDLLRLGKICEGYDTLIFNEPNRSHLAALLGTTLHPFVNHVTRHDMQTSIRAGFRTGEIASLLELNPTKWQITETSTHRGARRVVARRNAESE